MGGNKIFLGMIIGQKQNLYANPELVLELTGIRLELNSNN